MPAIIGMLWGALYTMLSSFAGRALVALGISVVTYKGVGITLDWLKAQALASLSTLPGEALAVLGLLKVGVCISIVFSAIVTRLITQNLNTDTIKKWVIK